MPKGPCCSNTVDGDRRGLRQSVPDGTKEDVALLEGRNKLERLSPRNKDVVGRASKASDTGDFNASASPEGT